MELSPGFLKAPVVLFRLNSTKQFLPNLKAKDLIPATSAVITIEVSVRAAVCASTEWIAMIQTIFSIYFVSVLQCLLIAGVSP